MNKFPLLFKIFGYEVKINNVLTYLLLFATISEFFPEFITNLLSLTELMKANFRLVLFLALSISLTYTFSYLCKTQSNYINLDKKTILLFAAILSLFISTTLNFNFPRPMLYFSVICSLLFFGLFPKINVEANLAPTIFFLIILVIVPLIFHILLIDNSSLYISESFRGLQNSRNDFGFICGFLLLLIFISKKYILINYLFIPFIIISFNLSASRTSFIAVTLSSILLIFSYIRLRDLKRIFIICLSLTFIWLPPNQWNPLVDNNRNYRSISLSEPFSYNVLNNETYNIGLFHTTSEREIIFDKTIDSIFDHFWFGRGDYYQQITWGNKFIEPHNLFLQSILNFGFFVTIFWCLLLLKYFLHISNMGRALILFMIIYGQFQPGFDAFLFAPAVLAVFIASFRPRIDSNKLS